VQGILQSPAMAALGAPPQIAGQGIYAFGRDDEPGAQFLNGLPPTGAGKGRIQLDVCGVPTPFSILRCGRGQ
jgi:hypothetical protein